MIHTVGRWAATGALSLCVSVESYLFAMQLPGVSASGESLDFWKWAVGQAGLLIALVVTLKLLSNVLNRWTADAKEYSAAMRTQFDAQNQVLQTVAGALTSNREISKDLIDLVADLRAQLDARDREHREQHDTLDRRRK